MSSARDRVSAHRLVLASLTGDDDAFERALAELDPDACRRVIGTLADGLARVLVRLGARVFNQGVKDDGRERAIREVERLIAARLDDIDAGLP